MTCENFNLNSQEFYYHVSPIHLESGSIIKKGNWGRVIKLYMGNCNGLNLFREHVFEDVRTKHFPEKPSRLDTIFLLFAYDDAIRYLTMDNEACRTSLIYKVRILDAGAPFHIGNFMKVTVQPPLCHFDHMDDLAHNYWNGTGLYDPFPIFDKNQNTLVPIQTIELLAQSNIEIIECMNLAE
jgi:hypothetical protein